MTFSTNIHVPLRMNCNKFHDPWLCYHHRVKFLKFYIILYLFYHNTYKLSCTWFLVLVRKYWQANVKLR